MCLTGSGFCPLSTNQILFLIRSHGGEGGGCHGGQSRVFALGWVGMFPSVLSWTISSL